MFKSLKSKVDARFNELAVGEMYVVGLEKNELFNAYIAALPESERAEHICNCCRHFLNSYGGIVGIKDGTLQTLWDFETIAPYDKVPKALHDLVMSKSISGMFLSDIQKLGTDHNHQRLENGEIIRWDHFYTVLPKHKLVNTSSKSLDTIQGEFRGTRDVFRRSLETLTIESTETVLDLINQKLLYRGQEFESLLQSFLKHQKAYKKSEAKELYVWANFKEGGRVRNMAIGQLLVDLSEGRELDKAVLAFESMVAPANYRRPTGIVTTNMIKQAQDTIAALGTEMSMHRRHAHKDDIPVSNLLYVSRDGRGDSVFDVMKAEVPVNMKSFARAQEMTLADFIKDILPTATKMEVLLENNSAFMSLIAPEHSHAPNILAWDNPISWTYQNNMTDVIKEKVKKAGGAVEGELRVSLEWFNDDDLDLYVTEPNQNTICFTSKRSNQSDGFLDVDMNAGRGCPSRLPVENIIFKDRTKILEGSYTVRVNNYSKRENIDLGFNVEIECRGKVHTLAHPKAVVGNKMVATFTYTKADGITNFKTTLSKSLTQKEVNKVLTNQFQQVTMMMYSPNHWTNSIGNKHVFFIIDKARVENPLRPFFNEYLKPSFQEHRKVFEILGSKLMVEESDQQLTGIGFSLTQKSQVIVRVNNGLVIKVNI